MSAGAIGVYGKIAGQPDFLRAGAGAFSQAKLDIWFQEGMEALRTERTTLPAGPTAFLLAPPGAGVAFVGAFAPSTDAAGRSFPLAVFAEIPTEELTDALPSLPSACAPFLGEVGQLLAASQEIDGAAFNAHAFNLSPPTLASVAWPRTSALPVTAALGGAPSATAYALRTLVMACDQASKAGAGATGPTVDAPLPILEASGLWLEIARRRLAWREGTPSLLWTSASPPGLPDAPPSRLLVTLGQPTPSALAYLANPSHRSARLWPLRTSVATAAEQAWAALTPEQRRAVEDPHASLGDLVTAFG